MFLLKSEGIRGLQFQLPRIESEGLLKVTDNHIHCESGNMSEAVQGKDVVITD